MAAGEYDRRLDRAQRELALAGIEAADAMPFNARMARLLGLRPRPLPYSSIWQIIALHGLVAGVFWGAIVALAAGLAYPASTVLVMTLIAAALLAAIATIMTWGEVRELRKTHQFTPWDQL